MTMKKWTLGAAAALALFGGVALAQTAFPLVSAVTGGMIVKNEASPTYSYMTVDLMGTYLLTGAGGAVATVPHGGTGAATLSAHSVLVGEGTSAVTPITVGTTGQLLQGATAADPAWATALTGNYTLSGVNTFTGTLNQFGSASGTPAHLSSAQTTAPALTSCGTGSPAITGTDSAGIVTMGTGATGCVVTFNVAYTGTPYCVVSWIATPLASQSYVTSNAAITVTQTSASGNKLQYICVGTAGG